MARGRGASKGVRARGRGGAAAGAQGGSRMPPQLFNSYRTGKVAARIRWGSPGAGRRCAAQAAAHGVKASWRYGMCQNVAQSLGLHIGAKGRGGKRG